MMFWVALVWGFLNVVKSDSPPNIQKYDSKSIMKQVSIICTTSEFSKVEMVLDDYCPGHIREELNALKKIQVKKDTTTEEIKDNMLKNNFRQEMGENIKMTQDADAIHKTKVVVDLSTVMERYTKYDGSIVWKEAHKIAENDPLLSILVSGIHASVSIHLCSFYNEDPKNSNFFMNHSLITEKVSNEYFENLKYTVDFLISLLSMGISEISKIPRRENGKSSVRSLEVLLKKPSEYDYMFYRLSETTLKKAKDIAELVGCVDCRRCQVWGKIQLEGLVCAVKLLILAQGHKVSFSQFEIVAYVNLLNRASTSIAQYNRYLVDMKKSRRIR